MINRKKCIQNLNELIKVIDKESEDLYNAFYVDHPQQTLWSIEAETEFKDLRESRHKLRENAENLIHHFLKSDKSVVE